MAALNFPSSPAVKQIYSANNKSWVYDGVTWISSAWYLELLALVSTAQATSGGTINTPAMAVTGGNHLFVLQTGGDVASGCTDSAGNVYTATTSKVYGGSTKARWFYSLNVTGHAANVVTVTISPVNGGNMAQVIQFSGSLTAFDAEQTGQNQGDITCGNCGGAITTTGTKPLILLGIAGGNMTNQGGSFSQGTLIASSTNIGQAAYYLPGGPSSSLFTWSGMLNQAHVMAVVAFK